jgi:hypothetical protein
MEYFVRKVMAAVFVLLVCTSVSSFAQSANRKIPAPDWVKAIDDPGANYYKAIKSYESFWKAHEKPADEEQLMSKSREQVQGNIKKLSKKEMKEQRLMDYYRYECKRFDNWVHENKPYVQADGRILSADERLKQWEQTKKERQ